MIENKKQNNENDILLTTIMALLNICMVAVIGGAIWSVISLVEHSAAIAKFMNGNFIQ